jgi:hypothetical protein
MFKHYGSALSLLILRAMATSPAPADDAPLHAFIYL